MWPYRRYSFMCYYRWYFPVIVLFSKRTKILELYKILDFNEGKKRIFLHPCKNNGNLFECDYDVENVKNIKLFSLNKDYNIRPVFPKYQVGEKILFLWNGKYIEISYHFFKKYFFYI